MKAGKEAQWARATKIDVLSSVPLIHRVEGENRWFQVVPWLLHLCPPPAPPINKQTKTNVQKFGELMKLCELMLWRLWQFSCAHSRGLPGFHSTCLWHEPSNRRCFHQVCWEFIIAAWAVGIAKVCYSLCLSGTGWALLRAVMLSLLGKEL